MAVYDFSIRTKLAIWAGVGVLLVAGMLAEQQYGDYSAARHRIAADSKQLAALEALRAADDLRSMQLETREIRLSVAPSEFDRALNRLTADETAAAGHIEIALEITDEPADRERLEKLAELVKAYVGVVTELVAAAKEYGDTVDKIKRSGELGAEMNALIESTTTALIAAADQRKAQAVEETTRVSRVDLGMGLFVIAVLAGIAVFGAVTISGPIRRVGEVLLELTRGHKNVEVPYTGRRDEVGDAARAAQTFKEKLIRIEQLEGAEKETARRTADRRQADMQAARRRLRKSGGKRRPLGVVVIDRAGSGGRSLERNGGSDPGSVRQGLVGIGASLRERALGVARHRTADRFGRRDQPAGAGIDPDCRARPWRRPRRPTAASPS